MLKEIYKSKMNLFKDRSSRKFVMTAIITLRGNVFRYLTEKQPQSITSKRVELDR